MRDIKAQIAAMRKRKAETEAGEGSATPAAKALRADAAAFTPGGSRPVVSAAAAIAGGLAPGGTPRTCMAPGGICPCGYPAAA